MGAYNKGMGHALDARSALCRANMQMVMPKNFF